MLNSLYQLKSSCCKIYVFFRSFFDEICTKPTANTLTLMILSMIVVEGVDSVRCVFRHYFSKLTDKSLNSMYYALSYANIECEALLEIITKRAVTVIPESLSTLPVFLCVDDTMIQKFGKKFDNVAKLFDHARHDGKNYINGHCFVSLMICVPVWSGDTFFYNSIPVGYKMWIKDGKSKLELSAQMIQRVMPHLSDRRNVIVLCDSWYAKKPLFDLTTHYQNLDLICNARIDTVLYDLPPAPTGKKGRPAKHGNRITLEMFHLSDDKIGDYHVGTRKVMTNLLKWEAMDAFVTAPEKEDGQRRLFLSTISAARIQMFCAWYEKAPLNQTGSSRMMYIPYMLYSLRWNLEVSYLEQKTFWSLTRYMVRKQKGIEMLINLISLSYAGMKLLPLVDPEFEKYKKSSPQEIRFFISQEIQEEVFMASLLDYPQVDINSAPIQAWLASKGRLNHAA